MRTTRSNFESKQKQNKERTVVHYAKIANMVLVNEFRDVATTLALRNSAARDELHELICKSSTCVLIVATSTVPDRTRSSRGRS